MSVCTADGGKTDVLGQDDQSQSWTDVQTGKHVLEISGEVPARLSAVRVRDQQDCNKCSCVCISAVRLHQNTLNAAVIPLNHE